MQYFGKIAKSAGLIQAPAAGDQERVFIEKLRATQNLLAGRIWPAGPALDPADHGGRSERRDSFQLNK